jgi:hypothetical protein
MMINAEGDMHDAKGERIFFSRDAMMHNTKQIDLVRTFLTIILGFSAGILSCTGLNGVILYIAVYLIIQICILAIMSFDSARYTTIDPIRFLVSGISEYALSYVLFWTLSYALVYIY